MVDRPTVTAAPDLISVSTPMPQPGQVLAGRFLLERQLGSGGAGVVFAARDTTIDQRLAIKVLHPHVVDERSRERVRREVRASRPGHPNAVSIFELYETDGLVFLAMELIKGPNLSEILKERERLAVDEVIGLGRGLAAALAHLADRGLVHRDIKPGNVLMGPDGINRLCDTGLVRPTASGETVTEHAMVVGTPAYMAPEQASGAELSPQADIYALGLTLFKSLTGEVPLVETSAVATAVTRSRSRPPKLRSLCPECPRWLERLLRWMLEPKPGDRPTAKQVAEAFEQQRLRPRLNQSVLRAAVVMTLFIVAAWAGFSILGTRQTTRIEIGETTITGVDQHGTTTWQQELEQPIRQTLQTDLDGDGKEETIVAAWPVGSTAYSKDGGPAEIAIIDLDGRLRSRIHPGDLIRYWSYPFGKAFTADVHNLDIDGDGNPELVAICRHRLYYPTILLVYWAQSNTWELIADHPGYIYSITAPESDGIPNLRFLAVNNELGVNPIFCELEIQHPAQRTTNGALAYPHTHPFNISFDFVSIRSYVLLDPSPTPHQKTDALIRNKTDFDWAMGNNAGRLDRWHNPVQGINVGRDLRADRIAFVLSLRRLSPTDQPRSMRQVESVLGTIERKYERLLAEVPYQATLSLIGSGALARTGNTDKAIVLLRNFIDGGPNRRQLFEDSVFRLANLEAITGNLAAAESRTIGLTRTGNSTRSRFDAPYLLLAIGIESKSNSATEMAISRLEAEGQHYSDGLSPGAALRARTNLWWDTVDESDALTSTVTYAPTGSAIACLARWRLDKTRPTDPAEMTQLAEQTPEAKAEACIAQAAANLNLDRPTEALTELDKLINALTIEASVDFRKKQLRELARALRLKALAASGSRDSAVKQAKLLMPELTEGLLPERLVTEVIETP